MALLTRMAKNTVKPSKARASPTTSAAFPLWDWCQIHADQPNDASPTITVSSIHMPRRDRLGSRAEMVRISRAPPIRMSSGMT